MVHLVSWLVLPRPYLPLGVLEEVSGELLLFRGRDFVVAIDRVDAVFGPSALESYEERSSKIRRRRTVRDRCSCPCFSASIADSRGSRPPRHCYGGKNSATLIMDAAETRASRTCLGTYETLVGSETARSPWAMMDLIATGSPRGFACRDGS
jgi:hypothetical protein